MLGGAKRELIRVIGTRVKLTFNLQISTFYVENLLAVNVSLLPTVQVLLGIAEFTNGLKAVRG